MGRFVYTDEELDIIVNCVQKYKTIIENKRTTKASQESKHRAWENIAAEFRFWPGVRPISAKQIKKCWENLKARARQEQKRDEGQLALGQEFQLHEHQQIQQETIFSRRLDRVKSIIGANVEPESETTENYVKVEVENVETITGDGEEEGLGHDSHIEDSSVGTDPLDSVNNSTDATTTAEMTEFSDCNAQSNNTNLTNLLQHNFHSRPSNYNSSIYRIRSRLASRRAKSTQHPYSRSSSDSDTSEHQAKMKLLQQQIGQSMKEHEARMDILRLEKAYWETKVTQALQGRDRI